MSAITSSTPAITTIEPRARSGWRAFIQTGAGSIASGLFSAFGTKIIATWLGPSSVGLLSTLQQIHGTALTAATLNGQTALVQGASAFTGVKQRDFIRTTLRMFATATLLVALAMLVAPGAISRTVGMPPQLEYSVRWLTIPVILSSAFTYSSSLLRVRGEAGKLAVIQVMAALAMALSAGLAVAFGGRPGGLVAMLGCSAAAALGGAVWTIARTSQHSEIDQDLEIEWRHGRFDASSARHFFSISAAMLSTSLLASLVLLTVRARITRISGIAVTGQFDAAWNISMNHVGLILAAMQVYYLPVLAASRDDATRRRHITSVFRMAILAAVPVIVVIALLKPFVISLLYSAAFHPAGHFLRWTLIGDYFKVSSWVLAIPMLAAADMRAFLIADIATQGVFLAGTFLIGRTRGPAESASIAFALSYAVNFAVCAIYTKRRHGFRFAGRTTALLTGGFATVATACWL
jgi:O-antigen/teichoic acid export membrane protein